MELFCDGGCQFFFVLLLHGGNEGAGSVCGLGVLNEWKGELSQAGVWDLCRHPLVIRIEVCCVYDFCVRAWFLGDGGIYEDIIYSTGGPKCGVVLGVVSLGSAWFGRVLVLRFVQGEKVQFLDKLSVWFVQRAFTSLSSVCGVKCCIHVSCQEVDMVGVSLVTLF